MNKKSLILIGILVAIGIFYAGYQLGSRRNQPGSSAMKKTPATGTSNLKNYIIGRWEKTEDTGVWFLGYPNPEIIQFFEDGTITMRSRESERELIANYKWVDRNHLRIDIYGGLDTVLFKVIPIPQGLILEGSPPFGVKTYRKVK